MQPFSELEVYAFSRAIVDMDWRHLSISNPVVRALLENASAKSTTLLLKALGPEVSAAVLAADPNGLPPTTANIETEVPELPIGVRLTPAQEREARETGGLIDVYLDWAGRSANQTPLIFHLWAGLFICGTAIARRLYVHTYWQQKVYPNLYVMSVALSTYYRKSAGMSLAEGIMRKTIPHLIMPNPGSSEGFISLLSGNLPPGFESLSARKRELIQKGITFSASRAILREEISGLFKAMGSDYMRGMKEYLMQAFDAPDSLEFYTNSRGLVIVERVGLSLIGVTTPAELANSVGINDWYNGHLARFALLTPEDNYQERPTLDVPLSSSTIEARIRALHDMLPAPPPTEAIEDNDAPTQEVWSLACHCWPQIKAYESVLRNMTSPESTLDDRLRPIYGRLHVLGIKVAIILAALDWAALGNRDTRPAIEVRHWYRSQMIVEEARASAHRLLSQLNRNTDTLTEERIGALLARYREGNTLRDLTRNTGFSRKAVAEALDSLIDGGAVVREERKNPRGGPSTHVYKLA